MKTTMGSLVAVVLLLLLPTAAWGFQYLLLPTATLARRSVPQSVSRVRLMATTTPTRVEKSPDEWRAQLTPEQFYVLREEGTEAPNTSPLNSIHEPGTFVCAGCGAPLFTTDTKFDSGTGWPSFYAPVDQTAVALETDWKLILPRTEVTCATCDGHLGHVFDDGPAPTGQRFCMNGVALQFVNNQDHEELTQMVQQRQAAAPYTLSISQVLPSILTNAVVGGLFFQSFLQTLSVRGGSITSPLDLFPLIPAVYFGVLATQSVQRAL
mmetsp:Transcript_32416/g.67602  ORF Transcript_32416/g.67602 Transcript_32416/m.67602 type:complete len:266 (-) Transcript_32416:1709-2506(-)